MCIFFIRTFFQCSLKDADFQTKFYNIIKHTIVLLISKICISGVGITCIESLLCNRYNVTDITFVKLLKNLIAAHHSSSHYSNLIVAHKAFYF